MIGERRPAPAASPRVGPRRGPDRDHQHQVLLEEQPWPPAPSPATGRRDDGQVELAAEPVGARARWRSSRRRPTSRTPRVPLAQPRPSAGGPASVPVVPIIPARTVPVDLEPCIAATSATSASTSDQHPAGPGDHDRSPSSVSRVPIESGRRGARPELALQPGHVGRDVGLDGSEVPRRRQRSSHTRLMATSACRCRNLHLASDDSRVSTLNCLTDHARGCSTMARRPQGCQGIPLLSWFPRRSERRDRQPPRRSLCTMSGAVFTGPGRAERRRLCGPLLVTACRGSGSPVA
jgi:hypothetical protein